MAAQVRGRDAALAAAREAALRNERIVALGNLAAGAAHELGTPLSTMAVLAGELARRSDLPPDARDDTQLIVTQVLECKRIISALTERAGSPRAEAAAPTAVDAWMDQVVQRWRLQRPSAAGALDRRGPMPGPRVAVDPALERAMLNLLNNAADANPAGIAIVAEWDRAELRVEVFDRGPGIAPEVATRLGREPVTTRGEGRGYGVVLAQTAIERVGGSLSFAPRTSGGTVARMRIPLSAIAAPAAGEGLAS
jgi:two-component system sensor histidine kinase RegB